MSKPTYVGAMNRNGTISILATTDEQAIIDGLRDFGAVECLLEIDGGYRSAWVLSQSQVDYVRNGFQYG